MSRPKKTNEDKLRARIHAIGLYGVLERWDQFRDEPWLDDLITCEEEERIKRSLERPEIPAPYVGLHVPGAQIPHRKGVPS